MGNANFMTSDDTTKNPAQFVTTNHPALMYVTADQPVTLYSYKNGKDKAFEYTFKQNENFEIVGRNQSNTNEFLIKYDNKYAYISIPGIDSAAISGTPAANLIRDKYDGITFDPGADNAAKFNQFILDADNAKNAQLSDVISLGTVDTTPLYNQEDLIVSDTTAVGNTYEKVVSPGEYKLDAAKQSALDAIIGSYGIPPQWTRYVDPRIYVFQLSNNGANDFGNSGVDHASSGSSRSNIQAGLGRRYATVIISNPTIIELAPGYIKYSNWLEGAFSMDAMESDINDMLSESDLGALIDTFNSKDSKFYTIKPNFANSESVSGDVKRHGYIYYVNVLLYIAAIFLSRANDNYDGTFTLYDSGGTPKQIPYALSKRNLPRDSSKIYTDVDWAVYDKTAGFINIGGIKLGTAGESQSGSDRFDYIKFYLSGSTTANDQFDTQTDESMLSSLANTINTGLKEFAYWGDSMLGNVASGLAKGIDDIFNETKLNGFAPLAGIFNASEMVAGAKVVFPKIITESSYGKSIQCECTFVGVYGEEEALYLNTLRPYLHLLAFVLPHQVKTSLEMYTFPFLVKAFCRGLFNVEMGVISSFSVQRGGSDNALWSFNGTAELISVSFDVTPLITNLVMSSEMDGIKWLLRNKGLHEYMSAITAYDARNDKYNLAIDIASAWRGRGIRAKAKAIAENIINGDTGQFVQNIVATLNQAGGVGGYAANVANVFQSNIEGLLSF